MMILLTIAIFAAAVWIFMKQPKFGSLPTGERLERIRRSPNFRDGKFQNQSPTPDLTEESSYVSVMREFFFGDKKRVKPAVAMPAQKTDLLALDPSENVLVWFGHSSYFIQIDGKKLLVDPVLSGAASPLAFTTRSFPGTDAYTADELPEVDWLFLSHDHWDHLDHDTLVKIRPKVKKVFCGLGVGAHLERWGYAKSQFAECDWGGTEDLGGGFSFTTTTARHFSGRGFKRNQSLWLSYVLATPSFKVFLGGDSGYDAHFGEIGKKHGPFDLAILECGQYDKAWKYIHMVPEEVVLAAQGLRAKRLLALHWGKFALANHDWDDPIRRVSAAAVAKGMPLVAPMVGEKVRLFEAREFPKWWETVEG